MPKTTFARMQRSDHSMMPPAPALTAAHGSPNACNGCHEDRDARWADEHVRAWRPRDFQEPRLRAAGLVAAARARDWTKLDQILAAVTGEDRDEIHAASLIRLLAACPDPRKVPALRQALDDPSPLVRSSAAAGLGDHLSPEVLAALLAATGDAYRLVRIRAAGALAAVPLDRLGPEDRARLEAALAELELALAARPDAWSSYYNLGNLHEQRGELAEALDAYETATRLRPDVVPPYVNASILHARRGEPQHAERVLRRALEIEPASSEANYNLGLLLAETGRTDEAGQCLRRAFENDPELAGAAYNLAVLAAADDLAEAISWSGRACALRPGDPRYIWTHVYYLIQDGRTSDAVAVLERAVNDSRVPATARAEFGRQLETLPRD
jgi:Flp pilus assembly protein TadD